MNNKDTKSEIVAKIRKKYLFTDSARMTNVNKNVFKHASLYIRYDYLRQLTSFTPDKTSAALRLSAQSSQATLIHFTTSGQAAILQAMGFLKLISCQTYHADSNLYWETSQTFDLLGFSSSDRPLIYWIDSSSFDVLSKWDIPSCTKWVVVDTTCWAIDGEEFRVLKTRLKYHDVIFVRSHVKIDMLGVEYSPLGSISLSSKEVKSLAIPFYEAARLFATSASPESIPPYLFDERHLKLCLKRVKAIRKTHHLILENFGLNKNYENMVLQCPPHGLYFYMAFKKSNLDIQEILKRAIDLGHSRGIEIRHLESFGFDFFGLQVFKPRREPEFEVCLRISYGAFGTAKSRFIKYVEELISLLEI